MSHNRKEQPSNSEQEVVFHQGLQLAVNLLHDHWYEQNVGIVAATLIEDGDFFSATSMFVPEKNHWQHAEAATLQLFENKLGRKPKTSSTMIVTLSPCLLESHSRQGASCSHRLLDSGITKVRFGCLDQKQANASTYEQMGFDAKLVGDQALQTTCQSLYGLFDELYQPNGVFNYLLQKYQNPWPEIKRVIGLQLFQGTR